MGDTVEIPWALANTNVNMLDAANKGALQGLDLGQKIATFKALRGIDPSNADSLNTGITGLVHAGALDTAGGLSNLAFTRQIRSSLPSFMSQLAGIMKGSDGQTPTSAAPPAAPAVPDASATGGAPTADAGATGSMNGAHAAETLNMASAAADKLMQLPDDGQSRQAAFGSIKADMLARGVPEAAIDQVGSDLSDDHLKSLQQNWAAHATHLGGDMSGPAPDLHPTTSNWATRLLDHPEMLAQAEALKGAGYDITGLWSTAKDLALPAISEQAKAAYAGQTKIQQNVADLLTRPIEQTQLATGAGQKALAEGLVKLGLEPKTAGLVAQAQADAAPYEAKNSDGTTTQGTFGQFRTKTGPFAEGGTSSTGAPVVHGTSRSPEAQVAAEADVRNYQDEFKSATDPQVIQATRLRLTTAEQAAKLAADIKPNALTGKATDISNMLVAAHLPPLAGDANKLATYENELQQLTKGSFTTYPKTNTEFDTVKKAIGTNTTPGGAMQITMGAIAALTRKQVAYQDFVANHPEITTKTGLTRAWLASPAAKSDVFADPVFRNMTVDGKPVVYIAPAPDSHGRYLGVLHPNTPEAQTFRVR